MNTHEVGLLVNGVSEVWVAVPAVGYDGDEDYPIELARQKFFADWDDIDRLSAEVEVCGIRTVTA